MGPRARIWLALLCLRLAHAWLSRTAFNPDEHWQSLEVAHHAVYGYGALTWEWRGPAPIRGFLHAGVFALLYWLMRACALDSPAALLLAPRLLQAVLQSCADLAVYCYAVQHHGESVGRWALFVQASSWFHAYAGVRTLVNSAEAAVVMIGLAFWSDARRQRSCVSLSSVACNAALAVSVLLRPSAMVGWAVLHATHLARRLRAPAVWQQTACAAACALGALLLGIGIDSLYYGAWPTCTACNFVLANLGSDVASRYGTHAWHWYFSAGLPTLLGPDLVPFVLALMLLGPVQALLPVHDDALLAFFLAPLALYSLVPHKEPRFLYPCLSLLCVVCARGWHRCTLSSWGPRRVRAAAAVVALASLVLWAYCACWHQRGVIEVMHELANRAHSRLGTAHLAVLFLTPCHATPFYVAVHKNITMRGLDCSPPPPLLPLPLSLPTAAVTGEASSFSSFDAMDESDAFSADPERFFAQHGGPALFLAPYNVVVLFSSMAERLGTLLGAQGFSECARFFQAHVAVDRERVASVIMLCRPVRLAY